MDASCTHAYVYMCMVQFENCTLFYLKDDFEI